MENALEIKGESVIRQEEKCEFHILKISFLGNIISSQGIYMDQGKVLAVTSWPKPLTIKELQCFLEFCDFYRRLYGTSAL